MLQEKTINRCGRLAVAAATISLTACGGGGDSGLAVATTQPQGVYSGTLIGSPSSAFQLLVLEDDSYWALYGKSTPSAFLAAGFIQGQGASTSTLFTSSNAKDFGVSPPTTGSISASYVLNTSISGTITSAAGNVTLSGTPIVSTTYNYNAAADLTAVTGAWSLTALDSSTVNLTIAGNGNIVGSTGGCSFTGKIEPRASGKNVFDTSVTFGAAPCVVPGQTATGVALTSLLAGGVTRQLLLAGVDGGRTTGTALFGTR